jgi:spore cortex formation protein SpoVR/YcgB (stage V sporulation)
MNTGVDNEIDTFVTDYLLNTTGQGFEFANRASISIVVDDNDFKSNANQLDDYVFGHRDTFGTFYGNYYFHEINRESGLYSVVVYSNTTAQDTCSAYGAEVVESLLQYHY